MHDVVYKHYFDTLCTIQTSITNPALLDNFEFNYSPATRGLIASSLRDLFFVRTNERNLQSNSCYANFDRKLMEIKRYDIVGIS